MRYTRKDLGVFFTFKHPSLRNHRAERGQARRVAMIGRASHPDVIRSVERNGALRAEPVAGAVSGRYLKIRRDRLELPPAIGLDDRTLCREGRVAPLTGCFRASGRRAAVGRTETEALSDSGHFGVRPLRAQR